MHFWADLYFVDISSWLTLWRTVPYPGLNGMTMIEFMSFGVSLRRKLYRTLILAVITCLNFDFFDFQNVQISN